MMPIEKTLTAKVGDKKRETAYAGWRCRWKHWGGCRDEDGRAHTAFMDMPFLYSFEKGHYEVRLGEVIACLHKESSVLTRPSLLLWSGNEKLSDDWFPSKN